MFNSSICPPLMIILKTADNKCLDVLAISNATSDALHVGGAIGKSSSLKKSIF